MSDKSTACPHCGAPVAKAAVCSECGKELPAGVTDCPDCGCPVGARSQHQNVSEANQAQIHTEGYKFSIREGYRPPRETQIGDNEAEAVLRSCARWVWWYIIITMGLTSAIASIAALIRMNYEPGIGFLLLVCGIIGLILTPLVARVFWALMMIVVNISTNIRSIKHTLQR